MKKNASYIAINLYLVPCELGTYLDMQIVRQKSWAHKYDRNSHDQEKDVIIDTIAKECFVACFETEFDDEDDGVQESGKLCEKSNDEEKGNDNFNCSICFGIATRTGTSVYHFSIPKVCESDTEYETDQEGANLFVYEK